MTTVKFLNTYLILAQYTSERDEVEISEYLKKYPELMSFCLLHELTHASFSKHSLKHFWLDMKDRFRFFADNQLLQQWGEFRKDEIFGFKETKKDLAFSISYNLLSEFSCFIYFAGFMKGKGKGLKQWIQANMEAIMQ